MPDYSVITPAPEAWDAFVADHAHAHLLQTAAWGAQKSRFGWSSAHVALAGPEGRPVAGALLLFHPLPLRLGTLAYVPKGPLAPPGWWTDPDAMRPLWQAIHATARQHGVRWLKVEAPDDPDQAALRDALTAANFVPSPQNIQPPRTIMLDISDDEDAILARMKQKTRYNIRLSGRKGVTVREGTRADVASFNAMLDVTGERDEFGVHAPAYYELAYDLFAPSGRAALLIASYDGQDLAGVMVFAIGKTAWYFYGASTNEERQRMPTYAAQWAAIQWARARGCTIYDLWGVPDEDEETLEAQFMERSDGLWGVYRFKRGFGGEVVRRLPAYDYVYNPLLYRAYQAYVTMRAGEDADAG